VLLELLVVYIKKPKSKSKSKIVIQESESESESEEERPQSKPFGKSHQNKKSTVKAPEQPKHYDKPKPSYRSMFTD
jgi:hypothetical protein